jgi:Skp family chaperone for outer membrane proteins
MTNPFKNIGKAPSQIHTPNLYEQSLAETKAKGDYQASIKALLPTTYQASNKLNFQFSKGFALLYHFVSALLGLATVGMLAYYFSGANALSAQYPTWIIYAMFGLVFLILSTLLLGIEVFKSSLSKSIFKKSAIGEKVTPKSMLGLGLVMLFSIGISAVGGAILSYQMNDNSKQINRHYSAQSDSLRKLHDESLEAVKASIEAYKANLNKGSHWSKYATREKLDKAIETRNQLLQATNHQISTIQTAKEKEINLNSGEGTKYGLISALLVLVLEILSILCYQYQYVYHANCEKEAVNFEILPVIANEQLPNTAYDSMKEIKELLQKLLTGNNQFQLANSSVHPSSNKVGFSFGLNKDTTLKVNGEGNTVKVEKEYIQLGANERVCKHCNTKFTFKHWNATYCGEKCKIEAWEQRTGKKFNKKKGVSK